MNQEKAFNLLVDKGNLFTISLSVGEEPDLEEGEVLFKIDKYAFTTNNITYAVVGPRIGYWKFFPAPDPWGIVPVWGFADVLLSNHPSIAVGQRFYGYFPMGNYLKVAPGKVSAYGFSDATPHRRDLPPIYNYYQATASDPGYRVDKEDFLPIIKPLFATSFLNYHFLKEQAFFDADHILLTSASSKTALGLAFLLKQHQAEDGKKIIGLTSKHNVEFVQNSKYYDLVLPYSDVPGDLPIAPSLIVDLAGNAELLKGLHNYLGPQLKYVSLIGLTDWTSGKEFKEIPVAKFFFAPSHAQQRYQEWGAEVANARISEGLHQFIEDASHWIEIVKMNGQDDVKNLYIDMLKGKVDPSKGYIIRP